MKIAVLAVQGAFIEHEQKLKKLDAVAYVRFASVHREFKDIDTFAKEISSLREEEENAKK